MDVNTIVLQVVTEEQTQAMRKIQAHLPNLENNWEKVLAFDIVKRIDGKLYWLHPKYTDIDYWTHEQ